MSVLLESLSAPLAESMDLDRAVLETLAYSDVFDYPLRLDELHLYLPVRATTQQLSFELAKDSPLIGSRDGFYFLAGRSSIVNVRARREHRSKPVLKTAFQLGRVLGRLPFIRMVALTGSLAMLNSDDAADLDYMLVAANGRVWTARAFALLFGRLTSRLGYTLCPNLIVAERALAWRQHDLYSAHEICQMLPITGLQTYKQLRCINAWTGDFLPNASGFPSQPDDESKPGYIVQSLAEWALRGQLGNLFENWEMQRKVARFSRQEGFGDETRFDVDVCQGNFDHHRAQTRSALRQRLQELGVQPSTGALPLE